MADRKISDLTALTTPAAGDFLPIVDISESAAASKNKRITIEELLRGAPDGTAAAPSIAFESDGGNGFYLAGTDSIGASTNGVNRLTLSTTAFTSTLPFVAPLGAAATPSLAFTGDLNTGIYSPGADQVAISTNGTGRLFVNSDGSVRTGTTALSASNTYATPSLGVSRNTFSAFHIEAHDDTAAINGSYFGLMRSRGTQASPTHCLNGDLIGAVGAQSFQDTGTFPYRSSAEISFIAAENHSTTSLATVIRFGTAASGSTSPTERMRLDSSGRLGLGTSAPGNTLHVNSGNIGLGKFSDQAAVTRFVGITGTTGYEDVFTAGLGITTTVANQSQDVLLQSHNFGIGYNSLILKADGKVGIGTASPQGLCDVAGSNGRLVLANGNTSGGMKITATNAAYGANGYLAFEGYSSEYGRFDSSGRLLIGTSTARSNATGITPILQIEGTSNNGSALSLIQNLNTATAGATITLAKTNTAANGGTAVVTSGENLGIVYFEGADGTKLVTAAQIAAQVDGTPGADDMPGRLVFSTTADGASSPTERMRINNAGDMYMADGRQVWISGNGDAPRGKLVLVNTANNTTATLVEFLGYDYSVTGSITTRVNVTAYNTSSDYRLKENITQIEGATERLKLLKPKRFNFIANPDETLDGFLAHEAQEAVPEAISGSKDGADADGNPIYQGVDLGKFVPLLTAALQEAITKIETLEAKVAALEAA